MKLISWNVNGLRAVINKGFEDFFKEANADIFCLQETKMQVEQLDEDAKKIFTDVGEYKKEKKINHIMTNVYLILLYAVYAIFLIPLILIFI